ncbi:nitronate monooxygenase [Brevibacterium picturae]|uniref:Propionate 3-nitronate monooxygenase n=1 Tax=Brevibacterium picturae TaxID=260553 RepID=A0ABN2B5A8_9MICO
MTEEEREVPLARPLVLAPMAGGPSTPALAAAVAEAGCLPFLAAGYLPPAQLRQDIDELERRISAPFGVNLFTPDPGGRVGDPVAYRRYRQQVLQVSDAEESLLPREPVWSDDAFAEKLEVALHSTARFISFTFGHPSQEVIKRVHAMGKQVVLYATSRPGIETIAASHADVIGIQGPNAGGHRATVAGADDNSSEPLIPLVQHALAVSKKPIFAGGGVANASDVLALLRAGAAAVQVGTLFLDANEAGTKETHRRALRELTDRTSVVTRAFTGRPARAISNRFTECLSGYAPEMYPQLHFLTSAVRKQANEHGDAENLNLWAGTGFTHVAAEPAARIAESLLPYTPTIADPIARDADARGHRVAVVGAGPRGLAVVERLVSLAATTGNKIDIDWYDDTSFGAGRVWSPYQTTALLMNTVSSQLSAFPDSSTGFGDNYVQGPAFYDWLQTPEADEWLAHDPVLLAERMNVEPNTYTSRALYGAYLTWAAERIIGAAGTNVRVRCISCRVTSLEIEGDARALTTSDGTSRNYDCVVLALGHLPARPTSREHRRLATADGANFLYVPTGDATVQTAAKLASKQNVLLLGLGPTFFDYLELLTTALGGRYVRTDEGLDYEPSGREPNLYVSSRRGVPYHARGVNEKAPEERWEPKFLTLAYAEQLRRQRKTRPVSFGRDVWPAVVREVELAYTLAQSNEHSAGLRPEDIYAALTAGPEAHRRLRKDAGLPTSGFPWENVLEPRISTDDVESIAQFQQRAIVYLERDISEARRGNKRGAFKSALDVLRDIRNEVRQAVQEGTITDWSFREELSSFYTPFNSFVSIGPPLYRVEQLAAAMRAGTVTLLPPDPFLSPDADMRTVTVTGRYFPSEPISVDGVVEARQSRVDASGTADPLLRHLLDSSIAAVHRFDDDRSSSGAVSVSPHDFRVLDPEGVPDDRILLYGVPSEGINWGTAATIRPFVNSVILQDADTIVRRVLSRLANTQTDI